MHSLNIQLLAFLFLFHLSSFGQNPAVQVNKFLTEEMKAEGIPGLQLVVVSNGKIILSEAIGKANVEFSVPANRQTVFSINSIAKIFTGVAVMQLVENGKLNIDQNISVYLDSLPVSWQKVTLRQLLSHTSGLPDVEDDITGGLVGNKSEDTAWKIVQTMPLQFTAGEQFSYNATNYLLLQNILNKYCKDPFEIHIKKSQIAVAKMEHTSYGNSYEATANKAPTYTFYYQNKNNGEHIKGKQLLQAYEDFPKMMRTDAGLFSTAEDMAHWIIALQNKQLIKNQKYIKEMWLPVKLNNGKLGGFDDLLNGYALGWPVIDRKIHPALAPIGGGRAAILLYPDDNLSVILFTNLSGCAPEIIAEKVAGFYFTK
jgi:CubicO group peptidase (beta-lactamase class C family)